MILKYTFNNEHQYIEAWTYLMRLGMGFKYNRETNYIEVDAGAEDFGDPRQIKARLDGIKGDG